MTGTAYRSRLSGALLPCAILLLGAPMATVAPAHAQAPGGEGWSVDGVAGLFAAAGTDDPADSGPLFQWRYTTPVADGLRVGGQAQFRDDDPSRGRSQAAGLGLVATARFGSLYAPAGVLVEGAHVEKSAGTLSLFPEPEPGFHVRPRAHAGLGVEAGSGPVRFLVEGQASTGFDGEYLAVLAGVRSADGEERRDGGEPPRLVMHGNGWGPLSGSYDRDEDYRGYGLRYEGPLDAGPVRTLRGSLGIDFLVFTTNRRWSTGAISVLVGGSAPVARLFSDAVALDAVADGGVLVFPEGGGGRTTYPAVAGGLELSTSAAGVTPVVGLSGVLADAPAGLLTGVRFTAGVGVSL